MIPNLLDDATRHALRSLLMGVLDSREPDDHPAMSPGRAMAGAGPALVVGVGPGKPPPPPKGKPKATPAAPAAPASPAAPKPPVRLDGGKLTGPERAARIVATMIALWESHVEEPPGVGYGAITDLIMGDDALDWNTCDAVTWRPGAAYTKNRMFAWCGATAAKGQGAAGLKRALRYKDMASTGRLYRAFAKTARYIPLDQIQPGDVVVVGDGGKREGDHIVTVIAVGEYPGLLTTIEGNASGLGPNGKVFEGVVKRTRALPARFGGPVHNPAIRCPISGLKLSARAMHAYRFLDDDYNAPPA